MRSVILTFDHQPLAPSTSANRLKPGGVAPIRRAASHADFQPSAAPSRSASGNAVVLARELVLHTAEYMTTLDTLRTACANAESNLAGELGAHLRRPLEAKRALRNLLSAPGRVTVGARSITVTLSPAGTRNEMKAFAALLGVVSRWGLTLPGDPQHRRLRFRTQ